jgi:hypothetical protein
MADLAKRVHRILDPVLPVTVAEAEMTARRRRRRHRLTAGLIAGLGAAGAAAIALAVVATPAAKHQVSTTDGPLTSSGQPVPPGANIQVTIRLDANSVLAGTALHGTATVDNRSGAPIDTGQCEVDGVVYGGLTNDQLNVTEPVAGVGCQPSIKIPLGVSSYPITIQTTFFTCSRSPSSTTDSRPLCSGSLALPPGTYHVTVWIPGITAHQIAATTPVTVTLTTSINSTPSTTVVKNTRITYWGSISSSYNDPTTGLRLAPPPPGAAPAITWRQAAEPCVQTTGTNNCATPTSPENVYLALGSDKNFGAVGPEPTLMYVINENQLCSTAGNGPPARPDPTSTTTAPKIAPCTYLAFVNAATGQGMGAMSSPGLKPIPSQ